MRLLGTIKDEKAGHQFCQYLTTHGISNECEVVTNSDWGSHEYGDRSIRVWIIDEDQLLKAQELYTAFERDPTQPIYQQVKPTADPVTIDIPPTLDGSPPKTTRRQRSPSAMQAQPMGPATLYIIVICTVLFFWSTMIRPQLDQLPKNFPSPIVFASPIKKELLYDYPQAYELLDRFVTLSEEQKWNFHEPLPTIGGQILEEYAETPYWKGFYDIAVKALRGENWQPLWHVPWFEKISQGELWRLESPALLHNDLLHLLFNMLWLMVLGKQIEQRLGITKYLLFCLIAGLFSNTAQYLMSGSNFIGISGVLCAMVGYIWMRQRKAPWEGYQVQKGTLGFLAFFILAMAGLQALSFASEVAWGKGLFGIVANTAHLSGAAIGLYMGRMNLFAWRRRR